MTKIISRQKLLVLLISVWASFVFPASAETKEEARPVYLPDGRFGFCLIEHAYDDGRKLTIAHSPNSEMNLGLTIPDAGLDPKEHYDLTLKLDGGEGRKIRAQALDATSLLFQMGVNPSFRKKMIASHQLEVGAGEGKSMVFALPPMKAFFESLEKCLKAKKQTTPPAASAEKRGSLPENPLMPAPLLALLTRAGFTDIQPLSMQDVPVDQRPAEYIWQTGAVLAGVREGEVPQDKNLNDLIGLYVQGLKEKCEGRFRAGIDREKKAGPLLLRTAEAECLPAKGKDGQAITVALIFYRTMDNVFTVFTHESREGDKAQALAARDRLAQAILSLPPE